MALDLADYEKKTKEAVMAFWGNREKARQKQIEAGKADQGERAGVTAGKNMDGFVALIIDLVRANGLATAQIHQEKRVVTLPGYFRPTKLWDLLVIHHNQLVAAVEATESLRNGQGGREAVSGRGFEGISFPKTHETTTRHAGTRVSYARRLRSLKRAGYRIEIVYLRLRSVSLAVRRIAARVRQGGHDVSKQEVARRFSRGWKNFQSVYQPLADSWAVYENSGPTPQLLEKKS